MKQAKRTDANGKVLPVDSRMKDLAKDQPKLRISHFPQVPCEPFNIYPSSLKDAKMIMDLLAQYDLFQYKHKIKPDYSNATTLEVWNQAEKEWQSWEDSETGIDNLDEYFKEKGIKVPSICKRS